MIKRYVVCVLACAVKKIHRRTGEPGNRRNPRLSFSFLPIFLKFISGIILLFFFACSEHTDTKIAIVAKIGDEVITAEEFRYNYEFGLPHLKTGPDRKRTYLDYMINEKLLALEGYRLGHDQSERVKNAEAKLLKELKIEALLTKNVRSNIRVSNSEIREAINKSKTSFKFRYWVESDLEKAQKIVADMRERGYAAVVDDILRNNPEVRINPQKFETDYLTWLDVPPEVLDAIKDMPYGDISDPVKLNGNYFIYQVLDIRRNAVTENEYKEKASRYEQIVFYQKYQEALAKYIGDLMEPKEIVTKGDAFKKLLAAFEEWGRMEESQRLSFAKAVKEATEKHPSLIQLKKSFNQTFMRSKEESLTIEAFLDIFDAVKAVKSEKDQRELKERLHEAVQLSIRDYFLLKEAQSQKLQSNKNLQKELARWRDKWVYRETRANFVKDIEVANKTEKQQRIWETLNQKLQYLKSRYPVWINKAVLDTISVVDFQKSRWASMQVFKGGSGRQAYPVVGGEWGAGERINQK